MAREKKPVDAATHDVGDKAQLETGLDAVAAEAAAPTATQPPAAPQTRQAADPAKLKVEKTCSRGLAGWLAGNRISLAISSYQTGRVYLVGSDKQGRVSFFERIFERAMGIVGNAQRIYLGGLYQLWRFENVLRSNEVIHGQFDRCYVPRNAQTIGDLDIHELGICTNGKVVFVNTKYSCLAELSQTHSFKAIWKPKFISKLAPEDRCHLNGLAMVEGRPKYVTAVCRSDAVDGWRNQRFEGLQLDEELRSRDADPWCGVQIVSLTNGDVLNWIRFEGDITEIFDISFLPNVRNPMMIGLRTPEIRDLITFESDLNTEASIP